MPSKNQLFIKRSKIPGAGKGLFTKCFIAKGTRIIEYKGRITTWKAVQQGTKFNGYVYYVNRNFVIDAMPYKAALARYANDGDGIVKVKGLKNNCTYKRDNNKIFIIAIKDIEAGAEILVSYGKEYWDVIRYNEKLKNK